MVLWNLLECPSAQEIREACLIGDCSSSDQDFTFSSLEALVEKAGEQLSIPRAGTRHLTSQEEILDRGLLSLGTVCI